MGSVARPFSSATIVCGNTTASGGTPGIGAPGNGWSWFGSAITLIRAFGYGSPKLDAQTSAVAVPPPSRREKGSSPPAGRPAGGSAVGPGGPPRAGFRVGQPAA